MTTLKDCKNYEEYCEYKDNLKKRVISLEQEILATPQMLRDAVNPKKKTAETVKIDPIVGPIAHKISAARLLPYLLKLHGKSKLASLMPLGLSLVKNLLTKTELPTRVLERIIEKTELTVKEEKVLADAALERLTEQEQIAIINSLLQHDHSDSAYNYKLN